MKVYLLEDERGDLGFDVFATREIATSYIPELGETVVEYTLVDTPRQVGVGQPVAINAATTKQTFRVSNCIKRYETAFIDVAANDKQEALDAARARLDDINSTKLQELNPVCDPTDFDVEIDGVTSL
jgi:hypothetical protein